MMKKTLMAVALSCTAAMAQAADVLKGDAEAGAQKAVICSACHGTDGNSLVPMFPKLAGLGERYLLEQTQHIRDGLRPVATDGRTGR